MRWFLVVAALAVLMWLLGSSTRRRWVGTGLLDTGVSWGERAVEALPSDWQQALRDD